VPALAADPASSLRSFSLAWWKSDMSDDRPDRAPSAASRYPLSRLSAKHDLIDMAREIQAADSMLSAVVGGELEAIARQIRALQEQAQRTLQRAQRDAELHRARCSFKKRPGLIYHLYRRADDDRYFSMLSPEDWRGSPPHAYEGSYRLEADMRFTPLDEIAAREQEWAQLRPLLNAPRHEPSGGT
jgi:hypothetical protein